MLDRIAQDLRLALRTLRRSPRVAIACGMVFAVGIGANTAIFGVLDAVLLRKLPFPDPDRLVTVNAGLRGFGIPNVGMSVLEFEDFQDRSGVFDEITFVWPMHGNLTGIDHPERIEALTVGPNYFHLLGWNARLGRTFRPSDIHPGICEAAVLSDAAWRRLFGADPKVIGRKVWLDYDTFYVIGVMPPDFRHPGNTLEGAVDVWLTGGMGATLFSRASRTQRRIPGAIGRLKPGVTPAQAQAQMNVFAGTLRRQYPRDYPAAAEWTPRIAALQSELASRGRTVLLILAGTVGLVLLVCCATVSMLMLARASGRRRELAIRAAIGAARSDLVRPLVAESVLVAFAGGAAGLLAYAWLKGVLVDLSALRVPSVNTVELNWGVLLLATALSVMAAVLSGLAPVLLFSRTDLSEALKNGSGSGVGGRIRAQSAMVAAQIAFSLILLVGTGLLLKSFRSYVQVDPGFNPRNVVVASLWLSPPTDPHAAQRYKSSDYRKVFAREVLRRMRSLPGVEGAAIGAGNSIPLVGWNATPFGMDDADVPPDEPLSAEMTSVSPDFLRVLGLHLRDGRNFTEADDGENHAAMVDETMARRFFRGRSPLGRRIRLGPNTAQDWWTIIGVVGNMKTDAFDAPDSPHIYFPIYQRSNNGVTIFLRTAAKPDTILPVLRREVQSIDPDLPVFGVRTMEEIVTRSMEQRRFALQTIGAFALVAFALAAMGIYGVTAFSVTQRTREIGIRMALGAERKQVLSMLLHEGVRLACWGLAPGLLGAFLLTRFLGSLLFRATATDPATYLGASALLVATALVACCFPALRATKIEPTVALREE
jgi:predicted permease